MTDWALLLRAVNLGATNKLKMADLRTLLTDLGHEDVRTLLNSGNAVFSSTRRGRPAMTKEIEHGLQERHGLDVRATLRTKPELQAALDALPRELLGARYVTLSFLCGPAAAGPLKEVQAWDVSPERLVVGDGVVYIAYDEGVHTSKLTTAALEKRLGVPVTARTPETVRKLLG
jgi:uncharacterized protein (DUF1697 family)